MVLSQKLLPVPNYPNYVLPNWQYEGKLADMKNSIRKFAIILLWLLLFVGVALTADSGNLLKKRPSVKAAVIVCKGMIDDGLYKSIRRRTQIALDEGAEYIIYQVETYGGILKSGDDISKYFILEVGKKTHTVAYITTEAISAGAMISVSCQDIIMLENTTIGDCAPIMLGAKLEGVEREKVESFTRAAFSRAAEANGYPAALLKAMVSMQMEVYRLENLQSGEYEFFDADKLPKDPNVYNLDEKELIVKDDELLTLTASKAFIGQFYKYRKISKEFRAINFRMINYDISSGVKGAIYPPIGITFLIVNSIETFRI